MPLILMCSNCGGEMNITDEMLDEAKESGKPFSIQHEVCPKDMQPKDLRYFKVVITMYERIYTKDADGELVDDDWEEERIAQFGGEWSGVSFDATLPKLQAELNKGWDQVQKMSQVIDGTGFQSTAPVATPVDAVDAP